ncbi:hypothetical protein FHX74_000282 [Friedmanniella endophytica]|uniref:WD40-like Beta Propeller Repeat n=1 Tax=Microlunatus kandeliicorticis TaxID=1759536 RepID=A0A7W3P4B6_9ACTN|nr:hypothetical protein [Microlunatus kandeliicorticis]MBA8792688.1 hypothetical protein [Microlunatus kandeliicorticis]
MNRIKIIVLTGVTVLCLVVAGGYFLYARGLDRAMAAPSVTGSAAPSLDLAAVLRGPHIVFRSTLLGTGYDQLAAVPLDAPGGPRAFSPLSCERVYATRTAGVCVSADRGVVQTYALLGLDATMTKITNTPLAGLPSRARMSPDGTLVSTTTFVTGHSYAQASFSTSTIVRRDGRSLGNLETFTTTLPDGQQLVAADRNYWGVTFAPDDDTFYATAASNGTTWLVRGSLAKRTMQALRTDAECPSLSPDGKHVAYKKRLGNRTPGVWRLAVLDLATGQETLLDETRSADDQMEWLDDSHVLYGMPRGGSQATTSDVWVAPIDGSRPPRVLIPGADSPAVVRM